MTPAQKRKENEIQNLMKQFMVDYDTASEMRLERFRALGSRGGKTAGDTKVRGGRDYYRKIGSKGGKSRAKNS